MSKNKLRINRGPKGTTLRTCGNGVPGLEWVWENGRKRWTIDFVGGVEGPVSESSEARCLIASWNAPCMFGDFAWGCAKRCDVSLTLALTLAWDAGVWVPRTSFEVGQDLSDHPNDAREAEP